MARAMQPVPADVSDIAVPLSTRISLAARRTIERAAAEEDISIRRVVELAIAERWGAHEDASLKHAVGE